MGRVGGVSGPAVRSIALYQVYTVAARSNPVIGMGGIQTGRHAADFIAVGARCVAVGTETSATRAGRAADDSPYLALSGTFRAAGTPEGAQRPEEKTPAKGRKPSSRPNPYSSST